VYLSLCTLLCTTNLSTPRKLSWRTRRNAGNKGVSFINKNLSVRSVVLKCIFRLTLSYRYIFRATAVIILLDLIVDKIFAGTKKGMARLLVINFFNLKCLVT
jgi:hypothetical protein